MLSMHRTILFSTLFFALHELNAQAVLLRGPYLQAPTMDSVVLRWRTDVPVLGRVWFGPSPDSLAWVADGAAPATDHRVMVRGLQADTRYYYAIGHDSVRLSGPDSNHFFRTYPPSGTVRPIRVWAIGDFGRGSALQESVRAAFEDHDVERETDVWLWLGDNAYSDGTDQEYQDKVFTGPWGYGTLFPNLPFHAIPGNHDYNQISPAQGTVNPPDQTGVYFDIIDAYTRGEAGGVPSQTELYYSFDYGNVHFICLNSELGSVINPAHDWTGAHPIFPFNGSPMMDWLVADLSQNTLPWTVVLFHQPPYSKGSHDSDDFWEVYMKAMREHWLPVLEQAGVDLVLSGHSHVYERSFLIRGHYGNSGSWNPQSMLVNGTSGNPDLNETYLKAPTDQGTVYVVQGNSGSSESGSALDHPAMFFSHGCDTCAGSTLLEIHGDTLTGQYLAQDGQVLDRYRILKGAANAALPGASSWGTFRLYPNPTEGRCRLEAQIPVEGELNVSLCDRAGQEIRGLFRGPVGRGPRHWELDLGGGLPRGLYYVVCRTAGGQRSLPVILR
jgi:hypothetical protein